MSSSTNTNTELAPGSSWWKRGMGGVCSKTTSAAGSAFRSVFGEVTTERVSMSSITPGSPPSSELVMASSPSATSAGWIQSFVSAVILVSM